MLLKPTRTAPAPPRPSRIPPSYSAQTVVPDTGHDEDTAPIPMVPVPVATLRSPQQQQRPVLLTPGVRLASAAVVAVAVAASLLWGLLALTSSPHSPYGQAAAPGATPGIVLPGQTPAPPTHQQKPAGRGGASTPGQPHQYPSLTDVRSPYTVPAGHQGSAPGGSTGTSPGSPPPSGSTAPSPPPISTSPHPHPVSPSPSPRQSHGLCLHVLVLKVCP